MDPTFSADSKKACDSEDEGFENSESWNPVTLDDIITNCQQFEINNDKPQSLSILQAVAMGPTLSADSEEDFEDNMMQGLVGKDVAELDPQLKWQFVLDSLAHLSSMNPTQQRPAQQRPTCYAPLFQIIHMPTHFQTHFELERAVKIIDETLKVKEVEFQFIAPGCTWNCSYINNASHGSFVVRIYRFPAKLNNSNHVIEMQRLDGDALIFRSIYETLTEILRDERIEEPVPTWLRPTDWSTNSAVEESVYVEDVKEAAPAAQLTEADELAPASSFEVPSMRNLKLVIAATLCHGRLSAVEESTQLACSIYSEKDLDDPEEVDIDLLKELMKIVNKSETNADWASQHAVWALANMSFNTKYCQEILTTGQLGFDFLDAMLALSKPGTFSTNRMRRKCVELLNNLVIANQRDVFQILEESTLCKWRLSNFVREVLDNAKTGTIG
jgi:hypothetical protein